MPAGEARSRKVPRPCLTSTSRRCSPAAGRHVLSQALLGARRHDEVQRPRRARGRAGSPDLACGAGLPRHLPSAAARPPLPAAHHPRRSGGVVERPLRGPRAPEERQHRGQRHPADVPGHRHGDRHGQEGPESVDRRRRRGGHRARRLQDLHRDQPALLAGVAARHVQGSATPAPTCRRRSTSTPPTATPTSSCSSPRAAARPTRAISIQQTPAC